MLAAVHRAWDAVAPDEPLRTHFLDETYAALYDSERRLASLFGAFGAVAVFIAALGLLGLATFTAQRRRSEFSIRKVLGASETSLIRLLTGDFARLVLIAVVVATPLSYWMMSSWLGGFAYHVGLGPDVFLLAGGGAMIIALLTVAYHALRAAAIDPVEALRTD